MGRFEFGRRSAVLLIRLCPFLLLPLSVDHEQAPGATTPIRPTRHVRPQLSGYMSIPAARTGSTQSLQTRRSESADKEDNRALASGRHFSCVNAGLAHRK